MSDLELHDFEVLDFDEYMALLRLQKQAELYANIPGQESSYEEILQALIETQKYNEQLWQKTDQFIEYNDEIVEIIELDEAPTMDISVAGDQLFYANGVLTKNSAGLVATCDFMLAIIETTELAEINQQMIKQLKSRYGDKYYINKFNIKVKKGNQKWIEMDPSEQRGDVVQNSLAQQMQANSKKLAPPSTVKSKIDNLIGDLQSDLTQQDLEPDKPKPVKDKPKPKPNPIKKSDSIKDEFSDEDTSDGGFKVRERKTVNLKNVNFS